MKEFKLFATLIQVAFIVMKLCGAIHWSWLLVISPILLYFVWMAFRIVLSVFYEETKSKRVERVSVTEWIN